MISAPDKVAMLWKKLKRLPRVQAIFVGIVVLSVVAALLARIFDSDRVAMALGAPALFLTGWTFLGHLLTIDDDMPGEWSNPDGDWRAWRRSLLELLLKATVLIGVLLVMLA